MKRLEKFFENLCQRDRFEMAVGNIFYDLSLRFYALALKSGGCNLRLWQRKAAALSSAQKEQRRQDPLQYDKPFSIPLPNEGLSAGNRMRRQSKNLYNQPWRERAVRLIGER